MIICEWEWRTISSANKVWTPQPNWKRDSFCELLANHCINWNFLCVLLNHECPYVSHQHHHCVEYEEWLCSHHIQRVLVSKYCLRLNRRLSTSRNSTDFNSENWIALTHRHRFGMSCSKCHQMNCEINSEFTEYSLLIIYEVIVVRARMTKRRSDQLQNTRIRLSTFREKYKFQIQFPVSFSFLEKWWYGLFGVSYKFHGLQPFSFIMHNANNGS